MESTYIHLYKICTMFLLSVLLLYLQFWVPEEHLKIEHLINYINIISHLQL